MNNEPRKAIDAVTEQASAKMAAISDSERLARAVLLFHRGGRWTAGDTEMWETLTGELQVTTKVLCNLARRVRKNEEEGAR
jgi:hypothetical protein